MYEKINLDGYMVKSFASKQLVSASEVKMYNIKSFVLRQI